MNNKGLLWVLIILQAIPVPFSLLTLPATAMSLASIGIGPASSFLSVAVPFIAMVLASTYTVTYLLSASKTFSDKRISFINKYW